MNDDVNCPYCGEGQEINHDDSYGYEEDLTFQQECGKCEKTFTYTTSISFYYNASEAPCLNDGEHNYEETKTYPKRYTRLQCTYCDDYKALSKERKEELTAEDAA